MFFNLLKKLSLYSLSIWCLATTCPPVSLRAMDRTPPRSNALHNPNIKPAIVATLQRALNADATKIEVDSFILTDTAIINLLTKIQKAHPGAVSVHLHESNSHNKKTIKELENAGISISTSKLHTKRVIVEFKDDDEDVWHRQTFTGSFNLTKNATSNQEVMVQDINDSPSHAAHSLSHQLGKKRERSTILKKILEDTPEKKAVIDNSEYDLLASLAPRVDHAEAGDILYIASMNYGHPALHQSLVAAAKRLVRIELHLDTDALKSKNIPLLDELSQQGVTIHFPTGKIKAKENKSVVEKNGIFHQKYLVRIQQPTNQLVYISTANATEQADVDFNVSTFYPQQPELAQAIIAEHKKLAQQGISYQGFKAANAVITTKRSRKKITTSLFDVQDTPPTQSLE